MFISEMFRERSCFFSIGVFPSKKEGAAGIHLYAMKNAGAVQRVYEGVRDLRPERT